MLSNVEKEFLRAALAEKCRIDGRSARQYRPIKIKYEGSRGCCFVDLGETKVMSQISWELSTPKESRPNEGILKVNVELSPLIGSFASIPNTYPSTAYIIELNRLLERCLRESLCLDLESLCIESGATAITLKIDLHVLNHSGNLVDALVIAGIGALKHFRRPDVTYCGLETTVHTNEDRDPLPLNLLHVPISTTFAFFSLTNDYTAILMDPTDLEEKCCDWKVTIAANKHREICLMQTLGSRALTTVEQIVHCCNLAIERAVEATNLIEESLKEDQENRKVAKTYTGVCMVMEEDWKKMDISSSGPIENNVEVNESENDTSKLIEIKLTDDDATDKVDHLSKPPNDVKKQKKKKKKTNEKNLKPTDSKVEKRRQPTTTTTATTKTTATTTTTTAASDSNSTKKKNKQKKASGHMMVNSQLVGGGGQSTWDVPDG